MSLVLSVLGIVIISKVIIIRKVIISIDTVSVEQTGLRSCFWDLQKKGFFIIFF